ncbi:MAG: hypothetical protein HYX79_07815 [Chloroflexi bacterium]|nr:hypothetical protein [Chloroflexota bacterium]
MKYMGINRKNIFLYAAIACLLGIIAIFVFGGYLGLYDTVYVSTGEYEQVIGPDFWQGQRPDVRFPYNTGARWGDTVRFRYEINNRRFSDYSADVEASLWQRDQKLNDMLKQRISLSGFGRTTLEWQLTPQEMEQANLQVGQYTVRISRGGVELGRGIILGFYQDLGPGIPPKPPVRVGP